MSRLIYGTNSVAEALTHIPEQVRRVVADQARREKLSNIRSLAESAGVSMEWVARAEMDKLCGPVRHQGVACLAGEFAYTSVKDFLSAKGDSSRVVVVADGIEDPQNLGSMLRAMGAFGADLLVVGKRRAAVVTPAVVKTSAGAAGLVPVARENALPSVLERLKQGGFWVYGLETDGEHLLSEQNLSGNIVLVIGGEGQGLSRLVRERCDAICRLPLEGAIRSLNAAQALACALYEASRQRKTP